MVEPGFLGPGSGKGRGFWLPCWLDGDGLPVMLDHLDRMHVAGVDFDMNDHGSVTRNLVPQPVTTPGCPFAEQPEILLRVAVRQDLGDRVCLDPADPHLDIRWDEVEHRAVEQPERGRESAKGQDNPIRVILAVVHRREEFGIKSACCSDCCYAGVFNLDEHLSKVLADERGRQYPPKRLPEQTTTCKRVVTLEGSVPESSKQVVSDSGERLVDEEPAIELQVVRDDIHPIFRDGVCCG